MRLGIGQCTFTTKVSDDCYGYWEAKKNCVAEVMRANHDALALKLARNPDIVQKVEDDPERTNMNWRNFLEAVVDRRAEQRKDGILTAKDWEGIVDGADVKRIKAPKGATNRAVRIFVNPDGLRYLRALKSVDVLNTFSGSRWFGSKWVDKMVHMPGGAVRGIVCCKS